MLFVMGDGGMRRGCVGGAKRDFLRAINPFRVIPVLSIPLIFWGKKQNVLQGRTCGFEVFFSVTIRHVDRPRCSMCVFSCV